MNQNHFDSNQDGLLTQQIIALYFDRNEEAIRLSSVHYGRYCMAIAMGILNSEPDAEECVNDTWLKAWKLMPPSRPPVLRTFLGKITRRISIDRYRYLHNARRNRDLEVSLDELTTCSPVEENRGELTPLLDEFVGGLDSMDRKLFVGRYWYNYSVKVMANAYGMTDNAVSMRLHKTRNKLRDFLTERGYRI